MFQAAPLPWTLHHDSKLRLGPNEQHDFFKCRISVQKREGMDETKSLAHDDLPSFTIIDHAVKLEMIEDEERDVKIIYMIILH